MPLAVSLNVEFSLMLCSVYLFYLHIYAWENTVSFLNKHQGQRFTET